MPAKKTPTDAMTASLKRLKLKVPDDFVVDVTSPVHANLQRLFACGMTTPATFDADIGPLRLNGIIIQPNFVQDATADGRTWRELARHQDVEVAIGIFDQDAEDPRVFYAACDGSGGWDDSNNVPLPGYARPLGTLTQFLAKVKRRTIDKKSKAPAAVLQELVWDAPMKLRSFTPIRVGGAAVLGRVIEPLREGVEESTLVEGVGLFYADGRIETVAMSATQSNYLNAFGWAGESIVTLGQRRNKLTHVGLIDRVGGSWQARELWAIDASSEAANKLSQSELASTANAFAYATKAEAAGEDELVHAWRRDAGTWHAAGSVRMGTSVRLFAVGPDRLWCHCYLNNQATMTELIIDATGVRLGEAWPMPAPNVVDQGRGIVNSMYQGSISIFERGTEVQTIKVKQRGRLIAQDGRLITVTESDDGRTAKPSTLSGYRFDGKAYVPWFEMTDANLFNHRDECEAPKEMALTQNTLYLDFGGARVRRIELP